MEHIVRLRIERLPEGVFLSTSDDVQGRTIAETAEIARDVARKLMEEQATAQSAAILSSAGDSLEYQLLVAT